jgi:glutaredoxin
MRFLLAIFLLAVAFAATAQTTYRWIDKEGRVHYTDRPPAPNEAARVEQKRAALLGVDTTASFALRQATADYPVTLYTQQDCAPCKEGRDHLARRGIPFSEKVIASEADLATLRTLAGEGDLAVPVIQVGRKTIKGFLSSSWDSLLDAAGYPNAGAKPDPGR